MRNVLLIDGDFADDYGPEICNVILDFDQKTTNEGRPCYLFKTYRKKWIVDYKSFGRLVIKSNRDFQNNSFEMNLSVTKCFIIFHPYSKYGRKIIHSIRSNPMFFIRYLPIDNVRCSTKSDNY